jgi:hypothetical protein
MTRIVGGIGCSRAPSIVLDAFMTYRPGKQGMAVERKG